MTTHLFLFGGGPPFTVKFAQRFRQIAKQRSGKIVVLYIEKSLAYTKKYTATLKKQGHKKFLFLPLGKTSSAQASAAIANSAGIIIGAGNTSAYAKYIVDTAIGTAVQTAYKQGIPVAGFSAGALISPATCVISPKDNKEKLFKQRKGLGLLQNTVIVAHYQQWEETAHLEATAIAFPHAVNYGINERTGIYFKDQQFVEMEGDGVFTIINHQLHELLNEARTVKLRWWEKLRNFFLKVR